MMNRLVMVTARKPIQRAFADWRTIRPVRSGVRSLRCADGAAEKRSAGTGADAGRGAGSRSWASSRGPGSSVIGYLGGWRSDAPGGGARRDDPRLAHGDRERAEGDLAGVDRERAVGVDGDAEAVHRPRRRPVLRSGGLLAQPVVAGPVTRALEPEVLDARVGLAAEVRAALVEGPHVGRVPVAVLVVVGDVPLLRRVDEDHERLGARVVRREPLVDRQVGVLWLDVVVGPDDDLGAELAAQVGPQEAEAAGRHLEEPQADAGGQRSAEELAPRHAL